MEPRSIRVGAADELDGALDAPLDADVAQGTRIVLVRHGEAWCNAEEFIGGHGSCRGLTTRGARQVGALAARLRQTGELDDATAFYTSVLPRAIETAAILAPALRGASFVESCSLCERHSGEADGLPWREYATRYLRTSLPGDHADEPLSPGGETWIAFVDRAARALTALALAHPGEKVVVASHGGVIDASMIRFLHMPNHGTTARLHPEHASMTEWQHTGKKWRLVRYSDAAHLLDPGYTTEEEDLLTAPPPWVEADPDAVSKATARGR